MLPLYVGCLALGGTIVLLSILLGGGGKDFHSEGDGHVDKDFSLKDFHLKDFHLKDTVIDKAIDLAKDIPQLKDLPFDKAIDLAKDIVVHPEAAIVPGASTDSPAADAPIVHTEPGHHPQGGGDLGALGWRALLSLRFWTFGVASFGFMGTFLSVAGLTEPLVGVTSGGMGLVLGYLAAWIFWKVSRSEVTAATVLRLQGSEGDVVLPVRPGQMGKIGLKVSGQYMEIPARTNDASALLLKERVLVVEVREGVATVTSVKARHLKA